MAHISASLNRAHKATKNVITVIENMVQVVHLILASETKTSTLYSGRGGKRAWLQV